MVTGDDRHQCASQVTGRGAGGTARCHRMAKYAPAVLECPVSRLVGGVQPNPLLGDNLEGVLGFRIGGRDFGLALGAGIDVRGNQFARLFAPLACLLDSDFRIDAG